MICFMLVMAVGISRPALVTTLDSVFVMEDGRLNTAALSMCWRLSSAVGSVPHMSTCRRAPL